MPTPVVIAVDVGGTFLRTALITPERVVLHHNSRRIGDRRGNAAVEELLRAALRRAHEEAVAHSLEPAGCGLAVPGLVDPATGVIRYSVNLDVRDLPAASIAAETVPLPVVVENDVRAAAWGEYLWGAGVGAREMAYLSAGTGIAAALIAGGRLYRGAGGGAGEIGHAPVVPEGDLCRCGRRGCLETVGAGWGIARRAGKPTVDAVFEAAAAGEESSTTALRDAGRVLGQAAVTIVRLWDPERLVLGGGLFHDGSLLTEAVREAVVRSGLHDEATPAVRRAAFGGDAGLMGAACLALAAG